MIITYMCNNCGCSGRYRIMSQASQGDKQAGGQPVRQAPIERFFEPCILLMLTKNSSYGYELMKNLKDQCGEIIDVGNLYRTLRRMEEDGWVRSAWKKGDSGPKKRIYTITSDGEDFLHSAALGFEQSKRQIERFLKRYKHFTKGGDKVNDGI